MDEGQIKRARIVYGDTPQTLRMMADDAAEAVKLAPGHITEQAAAAERAKVVSWLALPETWQDAVNCTMSMNNGDAARMAKWYSDRIAALAHLQESKP
jgi:hypothetical protein